MSNSFEDFVRHSFRNDTYSKVHGRLEPCQIETIVYDDCDFMSLGVQESGPRSGNRIFVGLDLDVLENLICALQTCADNLKEKDKRKVKPF